MSGGLIKPGSLAGPPPPKPEASASNPCVRDAPLSSFPSTLSRARPYRARACPSSLRTRVHLSQRGGFSESRTVAIIRIRVAVDLVNSRISTTSTLSRISEVHVAGVPRRSRQPPRVQPGWPLPVRSRLPRGNLVRHFPPRTVFVTPSSRSPAPPWRNRRWTPSLGEHGASPQDLRAFLSPPDLVRRYDYRGTISGEDGRLTHESSPALRHPCSSPLKRKRRRARPESERGWARSSSSLPPYQGSAPRTCSTTPRKHPSERCREDGDLSAPLKALPCVAARSPQPTTETPAKHTGSKRRDHACRSCPNLPHVPIRSGIHARQNSILWATCPNIRNFI